MLLWKQPHRQQRPHCNNNNNNNMMAPSAETMVLPAASSVHHAASSPSTTEGAAGEASRPPVKPQSHPTSSPSPDQSLTTPKRFRVKNVSLPESSSIAAEKSSGDNAVTPSTVGPAETPDSVMVAEENPVTAASSAQTSITARVEGAHHHHGQQWGTAAPGGNEHSASSSATDLSLGGTGAVSAAEHVKMNSRSGTNNHHHQQQAQPLHNHQGVMTNNHSSKAPSSAAFTQITPSIKLGPRISHGDNKSREQGDGEMPVMKLNMHRRGQSGQESFEELPSKKESSSASSSIASAPPTAAAAAPNTPSNTTVIQNAPQQQKQQKQQQQTNRFKVEHQQLPPPTFLAAKISPLRSKSSRVKKADLKTRGKTPPPPPSSAIAASSNSADVSFFFFWFGNQVELFFLRFFSHPCSLFLTFTTIILL